MSFGKMNTFIELGVFRKDVDQDGFATSVYERIAVVRAYREGQHGSQRWANLASFSEATDLFRFRVIPGVGITTDHIIVCDGGRYDIVSVEDVKGRGMYIEVLAKRSEATVGKG